MEATLTLNAVIIEEEVTGQVLILQSSQYNNLRAGQVTVAENITVRLFGTVYEKLIIGKNSTVYFHGHIAGTVENLGGELYKY